ncbi:MAG: DUF971 domain-containing protein [Planctomycetota bacterium]|nr:MAG: DUF971 domain-containing protein [Planctomycetota bacterium]
MTRTIARNLPQNALTNSGNKSNIPSKTNERILVTELVPPQSLRALKSEGLFEIAWPDGQMFRVPFKLLRCECPCAVCIDEITGVRVLRPESIPDDVHPVELGYAGNYALKIVWSDRHASGIFTWDRLRSVCQAAQT